MRLNLNFVPENIAYIFDIVSDRGLQLNHFKYSFETTVAHTLLNVNGQDRTYNVFNLAIQFDNIKQFWLIYNENDGLTFKESVSSDDKSFNYEDGYSVQYEESDTDAEIIDDIVNHIKQVADQIEDELFFKDVENEKEVLTSRYEESFDGLTD